MVCEIANRKEKCKPLPSPSTQTSPNPEIGLTRSLLSSSPWPLPPRPAHPARSPAPTPCGPASLLPRWTVPSRTPAARPDHSGLTRRMSAQFPPRPACVARATRDPLTVRAQLPASPSPPRPLLHTTAAPPRDLRPPYPHLSSLSHMPGSSAVPFKSPPTLLRPLPSAAATANPS